MTGDRKASVIVMIMLVAFAIKNLLILRHACLSRVENFSASPIHANNFDKNIFILYYERYLKHSGKILLPTFLTSILKHNHSLALLYMFWRHISMKYFRK